MFRRLHYKVKQITIETRSQNKKSAINEKKKLKAPFAKVEAPSRLEIRKYGKITSRNTGTIY